MHNMSQPACQCRLMSAWPRAKVKANTPHKQITMHKSYHKGCPKAGLSIPRSSVPQQGGQLQPQLSGALQLPLASSVQQQRPAGKHKKPEVHTLLCNSNACALLCSTIKEVSAFLASRARTTLCQSSVLLHVQRGCRGVSTMAVQSQPHLFTAPCRMHVLFLKSIS